MGDRARAGAATVGTAPAAGGAIVVRLLADRVHDQLREQILSGALAGGEAIRQDAVAAAFGISKIPLREALTRLEHEGLVVSAPNRGFAVSAPTASEAAEVFALRLRIEPDATLAGSGLAEAADHAEVDRHLHAFEAATGVDARAASEANRLLHLAMARPGAGRLTLSLLERLGVVADRYVRLHLTPPGRDVRAAAQHREIVGAWRTRDLARLDGLVRAHLEVTRQDLGTELAPSPGGGAMGAAATRRPV